MINLSVFRRRLMNQLKIQGSAPIVGNQEYRTAQALKSIGDPIFDTADIRILADGVELKTKATVAAKCVRNVRIPQAKAPTVKTGAMTTKGLTIPQDLVGSIAGKHSPVWLRPVNQDGFLVLNNRGTNPSTFQARRYSDGRLVITRNQLQRLGVDFDRNSSFEFAPNGTTGTGIMVSVI